MKIPKEYRDNLLNHIITKQMLVDCLYSVNKRAKNYRDKEIDLTGKHILLVEDNDLNADIAQTLLEDKGIKVSWAKDG